MKAFLSIMAFLSGLFLLSYFFHARVDPSDVEGQAKARMVEKRFEQMAAELVYFSPEAFLSATTLRVEPDRGTDPIVKRTYLPAGSDRGNPPRPQPDMPRIRNPKHADEVSEISRRIVRELSWHNWTAEELLPLLDHSDPKVRTLAAAALFATDDSRNILPLKKLRTDSAFTFPSVPNYVASASCTGSQRSLMPQTVRAVVDTFVQAYSCRPQVFTVSWQTTPSKVHPITADEKDWLARKGQVITCRDFLVWQRRANGDGKESKVALEPRLERIRDRLEKVPMPDRAWYTMVLSDPESIGLTRECRVMPIEDVLSLAKQVGRETLLQFLCRACPTNDPSLRPASGNEPVNPMQFGGSPYYFNNARRFVLQNAKSLLEPDDAGLLLAQAIKETQFSDGMTDSIWIETAAMLKSDPQLVRDALAACVNASRTSLAAALWRVGGDSQVDFLVDWFYSSFPLPSDGHEPVPFLLRNLDRTSEPDGRKLIARIVADPRFDKAEEHKIASLVSIVSRRLDSPEHLYPEETTRESEQLETLRTRLRGRINAYVEAKR